MAKTMTPKERVAAAFALCEPDRVPVDYDSNPGIDGRLKAHFGLRPDDDIGLLEALEVDFRRCNAPYVGPKLHADVPDRHICEWGIHRRWAEHESGGYWDFCDFPLQGATLDEVEAWPMPSPDHYDYAFVAEASKRFDAYYMCIGGAGFGDIINSTGMLFTMEEVLVGLMTDDPAVLRFIERRAATLVEVASR
ncbi:MAG TPA: hypothetical protein VHV83_19840, partial [Armatimonadota bacterium]|nr:hypothetical protein [Armatimonadota bacterium]